MVSRVMEELGVVEEFPCVFAHDGKGTVYIAFNAG